MSSSPLQEQFALLREVAQLSVEQLTRAVEGRLGKEDLRTMRSHLLLAVAASNASPVRGNEALVAVVGSRNEGLELAELARKAQLVSYLVDSKAYGLDCALLDAIVDRTVPNEGGLQGVTFVALADFDQECAATLRDFLGSELPRRAGFVTYRIEPAVAAPVLDVVLDQWREENAADAPASLSLN